MLFIVRGLPGSGKSTFAQKLCSINADDIIHLEADEFFMRNGKYEFELEKLSLAHDWCRTQTGYWLNQHRHVVVANTFTTKDEIEPYLNMARAFGSKWEIITCDNNFGNVHNVPDEIIEKMKARWEKIEGEYIITTQKRN